MSARRHDNSTDTLRAAKQSVIERYGNWTSHNVQLAGDLFTISNQPRGDEFAARRILQIVADITDRPLSELRVLDLACLEGLYGIELALHGASVVGLEVREANLAKARFVKEALNINNLELVLDDVRNLSRGKYGSFDVVLCLGILYHLDSPDVFMFIKQMFEVCRRGVIIDTHVSQRDLVSVDYEGHTYWGRYLVEHNAGESDEIRKSKSWSSIDNANSFWFTKPSLLNALFHAGFSSVHECHNPTEPGRPTDRLTLVAIKGEQQQLISSPLVSRIPVTDWPEHPKSHFAGPNVATNSLIRGLASVVPGPVKKLGKKLFRSERS